MLTINKERLLENLRELGQIGRTAAGGVSRPALSPADIAGRAWFCSKAEAAGLAWRRDGAGNLSAVLPAADPQARTILLGSHLDSVPDGGRYDGALGVLAALEALETIREANIVPRLHLEAISFTDEEGSHVGLLGSRALAGTLTPADLAHPRQGATAFAAGLDRLNITQETILKARRPPASLAAFLELHIEQGRRLEQDHLDIGVVSSIVGIRSHWLLFQGQAAHAGTTPMTERADALWGASAFIQQARALVLAQFSPGVMNVGQLAVTPGAFNIVPATVRLSLEFRHGSEALLDQMAAALLTLAQTVATQFGLTVTTTPASDGLAAPMSEQIVAIIEEAAAALGLRHRRLMSFAGHDAQAVSHIAPTAMCFVPSQEGISHNPREFTSDKDVANGANTLLHALLKLLQMHTL